MSENAGFRGFTAGEALIAHRRVKIKAATITTPAEVVYADEDEAAIGTVTHAAALAGICNVRLANVAGTVELCAGEAFAVGAGLYGADDGKVVDTDPGSGTIRYTALDAATADGDIVECLTL